MFVSIGVRVLVSIKVVLVLELASVIVVARLVVMVEKSSIVHKGMVINDTLKTPLEYVGSVNVHGNSISTLSCITVKHKSGTLISHSRIQ